MWDAQKRHFGLAKRFESAVFERSPGQDRLLFRAVTRLPKWHKVCFSTDSV